MYHPSAANARQGNSNSSMQASTRAEMRNIFISLSIFILLSFDKIWLSERILHVEAESPELDVVRHHLVANPNATTIVRIMTAKLIPFMSL